jgi:hypothetical protein
MRDFPMSLPGNFPHRGIEHLLSTPMEIVILLFWLLLMAFFLRLAVLAIQTHQQTQKRYYPKSKARQPFEFKQRTTSRNLNSKQWKQLMTLVQGDAAAANRLIEYEQSRNPNRSIDWCVEKALSQLERDRR